MLLKLKFKKLMKLLDYANFTYFIAASSVLVASGKESVVVTGKLCISFYHQSPIKDQIVTQYSSFWLVRFQFQKCSRLLSPSGRMGPLN